MKKLLLLFLCGFISLSFVAQNYKLLPDSCTYCFYQSKIGSTWYNNSYSIDPSFDTIINGNSYKSINYDMFFVRQVGNKVYGLHPDSTSERLVMDFDVQIGDTLNNLYSGLGSRKFYNAVVTNFDSTFLFGISYHRYIQLKGFSFYLNASEGWHDYTWDITWNEKGLCGCDLGGYIYNTPVDYLVLDGPFYYGPNYCTTDPLVPNDCHNYGNSCIYCIPIASTIKEHNIELLNIFPNPSSSQVTFEFEASEPNREIIITDIMGKQIDRISASNVSMSYTFKNVDVGIYLVHLLNKGTLRETQKIVIQN